MYDKLWLPDDIRRAGYNTRGILGIWVVRKKLIWYQFFGEKISSFSADPNLIFFSDQFLCQN